MSRTATKVEPGNESDDDMLGDSDRETHCHKVHLRPDPPSSTLLDPPKLDLEDPGPSLQTPPGWPPKEGSRGVGITSR